MDKQSKLDALNDILKSQTFKDAYRLKELLRYLVEQTMAGKKPKEAGIAIDVLGKHKDFDSKDDAIVRVYVNNLRNKLEHHYLLHPVKPNGLQIHIPKGSYNVEFVEISSADTQTKKKPKYLWAGTGIIILVLTVVIIYIFTRTEKQLQETDTVLGSFARNNDKPVLLVAGDFFFMNEQLPAQNEHYNVRDFTINSADDFWSEARKNPDFGKRFTPGLYTYLRPSALWGTVKLLPLLQASGKKVVIKLASQLTADDMRQYNVIFLGQLKSLFTLQKFLSRYALKNNNQEYTLSIILPGGAVKSLSPITLSGGKYEEDHSIIVRAKGSEESEMLLLTGFAEIGVLGAINTVCDVKNSRLIREHAARPDAGFPEDFIGIFRSEGLNQTVFSSSLTFVFTRGTTQKVWEAPGKITQPPDK